MLNPETRNPQDPRASGLLIANPRADEAYKLHKLYRSFDVAKPMSVDDIGNLKKDFRDIFGRRLNSFWAAGNFRMITQYIIIQIVDRCRLCRIRDSSTYSFDNDRMPQICARDPVAPITALDLVIWEDPGCRARYLERKYRDPTFPCLCLRQRHILPPHPCLQNCLGKSEVAC